MDPPHWSDILTAIAVIITAETLRRTPNPQGKHRKRKRYRRGHRQR